MNWKVEAVFLWTHKRHHCLPWFQRIYRKILEKLNTRLSWKIPALYLTKVWQHYFQDRIHKCRSWRLFFNIVLEIHLVLVRFWKSSLVCTYSAITLEESWRTTEASNRLTFLIFRNACSTSEMFHGHYDPSTSGILLLKALLYLSGLLDSC